MNLLKLNIPLNIVIESAGLILLDVSPYYEYKDGKKTDTILGYKYTVVETNSFEKFGVRIASNTPAITKEQINNAKEHLKVTFDKAYAKPYKMQSGEYELSFTAEGITILR